MILVCGRFSNQVLSIISYFFTTLHKHIGSKHDWAMGYHIWTLRIHFKNSQIPLFLQFSHDMSYISPFFFMSNKIILFQILYRPLTYLLFSLMKVRIVNFTQCGPCFISGPKFPEIWKFETFYIQFKAFGSYHIHTFYTH
jgi:hypothetical protein